MSLDNGSSILDVEDISSAEEATVATAFFSASGGSITIAARPFGDIRDPWPIATERSEVARRLLDILFALTLLIAVAPFLLVLVMLLQSCSPGPVFFVQQRVGKNGILFPCFKLRTMVTDASDRLERLLRDSPEARAEWKADHKLKNDPRITPLGRLARLFSLDELPQLANVLLGHMSIVGPRPIVEDEICRYGAFFSDYCSVRPGLTGLWQVSGRNDVSYAHRVRLDRKYARTNSLALDLKIIASTFSVVLLARGAY